MQEFIRFCFVLFIETPIAINIAKAKTKKLNPDAKGSGFTNKLSHISVAIQFC